MPANWVLVTGGNRGIGLCVCQKLAASGNKVILASRDIQVGREAAAAVAKQSGQEVVALQLDLSSPESVKAAVFEIGKTYDQQLYALINNAGIYPDGWTAEVFNQAVMTNYKGPVDLALRLAPHIAEGGRIVNVSSGLGKLSGLSQAYRQKVTAATDLASLEALSFDARDQMSSDFKPTYKLTKAMLNRATSILAKDPVFIRRKLTANACDPGWCRTDMGGSGAPRTVQQGADSVIATLNLRGTVSGGLFFDGRAATF